MDEDDIKKVTDEINELGAHVAEVRDRIAKAEEEKLGTGEFESAAKEMYADLAAKFASLTSLEALAAKLDEVEAHTARLREEYAEAGLDDTAHRDAVRDMLRTCCGQHPDPSVKLRQETLDFFGSEEYRTLTEGVATAGGLFVDPELEAGILKNYVDIDPVRSVATVRPLSASDRAKGYRRTGTPSVTWETETGAGSDSEAEYAPYEVPVYAMVGRTPVSGDLLDDVAFIESEVQADIGEQFSYSEGVAFVNGTGVHRPMGFTHNVGTNDAIYPASVASTGAGGSDAVQALDIPKMFMSLKPPYRKNATWAMNTNTCISVLSLQDSNGQFYWQPDIRGGPPAILYSKPFIICESLPDEAGDVYPLWIGDFRTGYRIYDRAGIQLLRDVYTVWPKVYFKMRKRVGGQVLKAEAIKGLKTT